MNCPTCGQTIDAPIQGLTRKQAIIALYEKGFKPTAIRDIMKAIGYFKNSPRHSPISIVHNHITEYRFGKNPKAGAA